MLYNWESITRVPLLLRPSSFQLANGILLQEESPWFVQGFTHTLLGVEQAPKSHQQTKKNFSMLITEFPSSFCQPLPQMILKSDIIRSQISFLCYILLLASPLLLEGLHALQSGANTTHCARQSEIQDSFPIENVPQLLFPEINLTEALFEVWWWGK